MRPISSEHVDPRRTKVDASADAPAERLRREVLSPDIGFYRARLAAVVAAAIVLLVGAADVLVQHARERAAERDVGQRLLVDSALPHSSPELLAPPVTPER